MAVLETITYQGFPDGSNLAKPAHGIKDTEARYIQDAFVYLDSETPRRGPLQDVPGMVTFSYKGSGLVFARDPAGNNRIAVLNGDSTHCILSVLASDFATKVDLSITGQLPQAPYYVVDAKPMIGGGVLIGISASYEQTTGQQFLILWRGANKADYSTGTITATYGSKTITGSGTGFSTNVVPGMFLFIGTTYVGTVTSVTDNTTLVLEEAPLLSGSGVAYSLKSLRGWGQRFVTGNVTVATTSTSLTGANTKFVDQGFANGTRIFRASDMAFIGTVSSVTNNFGVTLTANAAVAMSNDDYVAVKSDEDYSFAINTASIRKPGFLNASYAGLQFFANRGIAADASGEFINRLFYTEDENPETVDLSVKDGNFIPITSSTASNTPITALISGYNSLLILKEGETFALFGKNPNTFEVRKLLDDGALSGMSAVAYQGGVIWAGRNGIYYYDGVSADNIVDENLGAYYTNAIASFDPKTYRMWGFMHRDHYFLHIETVTPTVPVIKGVAASTPTKYTICIYMPKRAVTFLTNVAFRGAAVLPGATGQNAWMLMNDSTKARVISVNTLFDADGNDTFACDGGTAGPDFYVESKRFDAGDGLLKKLWKQIMLHYNVGGDSLKIDTVLGLNEVGTTRPSGFPITVYTWDGVGTAYPTWDALVAAYPTWDSLVRTIFFIKRIKFIKRSQYFGFRIYQNSANVTKATLGPFAMAYKRQRPGRV